MKTASPSLRLAQDRLAAAGARHIGDLVSWDLLHVDVDRKSTRALFETERLGRLIPDVDPATALSRAVMEVRRPTGILVRPFARPKDDTPSAAGIYVRRARDGEAGDDYVCGARCRVDRPTERVIALPPDGDAGIPEALEHAEKTATHANHIMSHCEGKDLSAAMVAMAKELSGVPLRDRGGFYLLPPPMCAVWARMKVGLEQLGVRPIRIEMHDAPDNVAIAKSAARGALEADIAALIIDLEKASTDGMRQHALIRRIEICRDLVAKADLFRGVLSNATDQITARVAELRGQFERHLDGGADFDVAVND